MAKIVNLRTARKRKARKDHAKMAEAKRVKFGRTKSEKQATSILQARRQQNLDGHKRQGPLV
jgi:hypothetical protein